MNLRKYGRRLLLPLAAPLLFASYGALAAVGGSATPFFPAGTLTVGEGPLDARIELVGTGDDFPATVDAGTIKLTISCGTNADPWNCSIANTETGVLSIDDVSNVAGGSLNSNEICNGVDFSFGTPNANGEILITPSGTLTFLASGDRCTVNFKVNVAGVPAIDASGAAGLQTAQGAEFRLHNDASDEGSGTGADTTTIADCSVEVDKQVSCDGGSTWVDIGYGDTELPVPCLGLEDDLINIRYLARNTGTGCALTNCALTETNPVFDTTPGSSFGLLDGVETNPAIANGPEDCSEAFGIPGEDEHEPDTVSVSCDTPFGGKVTDDDTASFACLTVAAKVDRNVSCDGEPSDDQTLVMANEDGTNGCTTLDGNPVTWGYQACNDGAAPLFDCTLVDANTAVSAPIVVDNLAAAGSAGDCSTPVGGATKDPLLCSTELEGSEATYGKVTLTCCTKDVAGIANCAEANRVSVFDESDVTCETQSGLEIVKTCVDSDQDGTDDGVTVAVSATAGDVGFTACTPTDTIYLDDPTCPPAGTGTAVALATPAGPYSLAPGASETSEGTLSVLTADACNTASVTCTEVGTGDPVTEHADPVICDFVGEGCITRTPGYWGTHPNAAEALLTVDVCGKTLNSVDHMEVSTTEAMCSVGKDGKKLGSQVTQLIRQCTAAALNHAVSAVEEGGCTHAEEETFADCCGVATGEGNSCSAQDEGGLSVTECIGLLDEFNNSLDTQQTDWFDDFNPADSSECRASKNNGYHPYDL